MIEELIARVFKLRNESHVAHWKTKSYSEHQALGELYDGIIDHLDNYVEAHQGGLGIIGKMPEDVENISKCVRDDIIWLTENRSKISKGVPALENILDELTGLHMKTLYKLENLR